MWVLVLAWKFLMEKGRVRFSDQPDMNVKQHKLLSLIKELEIKLAAKK